MKHHNVRKRSAFTLVELLVVIGIILALAALAAAFLPRVNDSQKLTRAVDSLQQWLLTAKMQAKRDGLAAGIRFVPVQGDSYNAVSTFQYVQQPDTLAGGDGRTGGNLISAQNGVIAFEGVDFTLAGGGALVLPGDYLEINGGGVYQIAAMSGPISLQLANSPYAQALTISEPTANYRIIRQPRILIGEEPLPLPRNYAAMFRQIPGDTSGLSGTNVLQGANGFWEIMFAPSGAVISQTTGSGFVYISIWDSTMTEADMNRVGIVGVRTSSGFIGAYAAYPGLDPTTGKPNPFYWVKTARESGM